MLDTCERINPAPLEKASLKLIWAIFGISDILERVMLPLELTGIRKGRKRAKNSIFGLFKFFNRGHILRLFMFYQNLLLPQVKRSVIISNMVYANCLTTCRTT